MSINLGSFALGDTVDIFFATAAADGGRENFSATLEEADFIVVKDGAAMTLDVSTITITDPFNSDVGIQKISIDLSNDADFTYGSKYWVYVHPDETIDTQSVAGVIGYFSIDVPVKVQGTFSGTHTSTTSDLGANAPANDITGMTLYNPTDEESRVVESYNTTTGVATHAAWDTGVGVTNGEPWVLLPTAPVDATTLAAIQNEVNAALLVYDAPTNAELTARTLAAAAYATASKQADIETDTQDIQSRLPAALVGGRIDATVDGTGMEAAAANVIRDAITGGAYALDTDANGRIRLVVGTAAGEVTLSGGIIAADIQEVDGNAISDGGSAPAGGGYGET